MKPKHIKYIGEEPSNGVDWKYEPGDKYYYARREAAKKLGLSEDQLEDEPDNDPASPEQAGWDKFKEGYEG